MAAPRVFLPDEIQPFREMRIGSLNNPHLVNSNYRSYQPLAAVSRHGGHEVIRNLRDRPLSLRELLTCDVVHLHRVSDETTRSAVRHLRRTGVGIVWDNDDDLTAIPRSNPSYRQLGRAGRGEKVAGIRAMVGLADAVTTPSAVLAEQYRELGAADVRVIGNHLPPAFGDVRRSKHRGVVVACLASLEHQGDYAQLDMRETLLGLLEAHEELRVLNVGFGLGLPADRCEHIPLVPFYDITDVLARADIGLAPLVDTPFNGARSNVKLKEYAAAGLAWLASPVGPYRGMGERQGGRLVPDEGWREAIARLITDARDRRRLARRGARWVKRETIDAHASEWQAALVDAAERARMRSAADRLSA